MVLLVTAYTSHAGFKKQKEQQGLYTPFASGQQSPSMRPSAAQVGLEMHVPLACASTIGGFSGYLQVCGARLL